MGVIRTEHRETFSARDGDGNDYTVNLFVEIIGVRTRAGADETDGMRYMELDDGGKVNWREKGKYQIVRNGVEQPHEDSRLFPL